MTGCAFGPKRLEDGRIAFRLWAPAARAVSLEIDGRAPIAMQDLGEGWREARADVDVGTRYLLSHRRSCRARSGLALPGRRCA